MSDPVFGRSASECYAFQLETTMRLSLRIQSLVAAIPARGSTGADTWGAVNILASFNSKLAEAVGRLEGDYE